MVWNRSGLKLHFEDVTCPKARKTGISAVGHAARPIDGLHMHNVAVETASAEIEISNTRRLEMKNVRVNAHLQH